MKTFVVVVAAMAVLACVAAAPFEEFQARFGKSYASVEEAAYRQSVFYNNLKLIDSMNAKLASTGAQQVYNVTQFTDLTTQEFSGRYTGYKPHASQPAPTAAAAAKPESALIPDKINWNTHGCITPVKNQEQCGSCWAFSVTETIESFWYLGGHPLTELSVQQIVSCDNNDLGCNGGDPPTAYQYVEGAGGLELGSDYPYTSGGGNSGQCMFNAKDIVAHITGWSYAAQNGNEQAMKQVVGTTGPLSICVDASTWQFYSGGILQGNCGQQLDHCVQLVGYDTTGSIPYWEVRNSWGAGWGESGYIRVEIGQNLCGIANEATYVSV